MCKLSFITGMYAWEKNGIYGVVLSVVSVGFLERIPMGKGGLQYI